MEIDIGYVKKYWEEFIKNERCNEKLNPIVRESWMRCKKNGVNHTKQVNF